MTTPKLKDLKQEWENQFGNDPNNPQQLPLIADQIKAMTRTIKHNIYKIGELLTHAKKLLEHGKFKPWIKENFDFSYQTANNFMNVFRHCLDRPELVESIGSTVLYTIASRKFPEDLREYLFKHGNALSDCRHPEIKNIMERYRNGEIDLNSPEIKGLIKYQEKYKTYKDYQKEIDQSIGLLRQLKETVLKQTGQIEWPIPPNEERTVLTEAQSQEIKDIIEEIAEAVNRTQPDWEIDETIKPNLGKTIKTIEKKREEKKSKN